MITSPPRIRVAAYIIRPRTRPELLIFEHVGAPEAGRQVPAGGVEAGESLSEAVLREVTEETGLTGVTIVRALTAEDKPHPGTGQPRRTTYFHLAAPIGTADDWIHRVEGTGGDTGMTFDCRFRALPLPRPLADDQDAWLGLIDPALTTGPARRK
ncbi:NUDIX domain-containing protein [Amycolatopsis umgeniensis]|uniref:ADP-ribose pyrophosphatase YjhB (NUDIX family) n=1 Tax=Amycolatopsis umgeniensis TaxID=336628 RepID=A0A841AYY1_9PSEU|nr:ADP-ribose pyrophosphatase YjhB (NUDIX family) [Amycolatopsis umgeniensis]